MINSKKAIVIGANGFLGHTLVNELLAQQWIVDCIIHKNTEKIHHQCKIWQINELQSIPLDYDAVFLFASYIPYGEMNTPSKALYDANIDLPKKIIEHFQNLKIIFSSSVSVYQNSSIINENTSLAPCTLYSKTKLLTEYLLQFSKNPIIIRYSSIYGNGMTNETFLPKIIQKAKSDGFIQLYNTGERLQDYIHVKDAAKLAINAVSCNADTFLGVYGYSYSNLHIANLIKQNIPDCEIDFIEGDEGASFVYNNDYTLKQTGFTPEISIENGLKSLIHGF